MKSWAYKLKVSPSSSSTPPPPPPPPPQEESKIVEDGDEIALERIESEDVELGFRLETDLRTKPAVKKADLPPHPSYKLKPNGLYERPLEDFIDFADSDNIEAIQNKGGTKKLD